MHDYHHTSYDTHILFRKTRLVKASAWICPSNSRFERSLPPKKWRQHRNQWVLERMHCLNKRKLDEVDEELTGRWRDKLCCSHNCNCIWCLENYCHKTSVRFVEKYPTVTWSSIHPKPLLPNVFQQRKTIFCLARFKTIYF